MKDKGKKEQSAQQRSDKTPVIVIEHLVKRYGPLTALDDVSIEVGRGEIVGLLGPNGAGKSTAMNILTGYLSASGGRVLVDGVDVLLSPIEAKRKIGYLPEQPPVYPDMTVDEYLAFVYQLKGCTLPREQHLDDVCKAVRITEVRSRLIRNLSKGYRQRVGIAQALIGDPDILILDEPTVGLDPMQIIDIRSVISELGKKKTLIISSHILSEISAVCSRVLIINKGKIIAEDTPENLAQQMSGKNRHIARIEGDKESIESAISQVDGIDRFEYKGTFEDGSMDYIITCKNGADIRKTFLRTLTNADLSVLMFKSYDVSLEDIFITLTEKAKEEQQNESNN